MTLKIRLKLIRNEKLISKAFFFYQKKKTKIIDGGQTRCPLSHVLFWSGINACHVVK